MTIFAPEQLRAASTGYTAKSAENTWRFRPDAGPMAAEPINTATIREVSFNTPAMPYCEGEDLLDFYTRDTASGTQPFYMKDPLTGEIHQWVFLTEPVLNGIVGNACNVTVSLERQIKAE